MPAEKSAMGFVTKEYGSSALLLEWPRAIDTSTLSKVMSMNTLIVNSDIQGIVEVVPAYHSLVVYFDPSKNNSQLLIRQITALADIRNDKIYVSTHWEIPVCYDLEFALDHQRLEDHCQMDIESIIAIHQDALYDVYCIGFLPGFTYLGKVDPSLRVPRLDSPRIKVPKGSVGIAGPQTGIYTVESPGGWNIIGRTHFEFFDPAEDPPCKIRPGDTVSFRAIDKREFLTLNSTG